MLQDFPIDHDRLRYHGNVCISGLTAAGKTTHAHMLAGELGLTYASGSQIQLNFRGLSPIQAKDFWITDAAKTLWNEDDFRAIDSELLRIESHSHGCIFDTSTMPWRHRKDALCIWLESDLPSRVKKSIISHRGRGELEAQAYDDRIRAKDHATLALYKNLYGIEIARDFSPFDLILDLSGLIAEVSLDASRHSITAAHRIVYAAAAWYLTGRQEFAELFFEEIDARSDIVVFDKVAASVARRKGNGDGAA